MNAAEQSTLSLEKSIIGGILLRPDTMALLPVITGADFADARAGRMFAAMRALDAASRSIDVATVVDEIARDGRGAADLAPGYLADCALHVATPANVAEYARRVRDAAVARRLAEALSEVVQEWREGKVGGAEMLSMAYAAVSTVDVDQPDSTAPIGDLVRRRLHELDAVAQARVEGRPAITGAPTGCAKLDDKVGGWPYSVVSIIAARPSHGKSSLKIATADACTAVGIGVHDFSLEDSWQSYADRSLARLSGASAERMRNAELSRDDMDRIGPAVANLRRRQGWLVDDRSGIGADEIVRSVRRHRKKNGTRVVLVDYAQLVRRSRGLSAHEALTEVINTFADAAKQDEMAYVVLSQLNRDLEKRPDKRPQMSDLRESGSLEERAKGPIVFVYRGWLYGGDPKRGIDWDCDCPRALKRCHHAPTDEQWERQAQLIVGKNSNGRTGRVFAKWTPESMRME